MDVRTLEYFVLVAEEGSITGGARRARVAQPAVSVALKKLEREIGGSLFRRSFQGVELTPAGSTLLPRARQILRSLNEAKHEATHEARLGVGGRRPAFTIGLTAGRAAAGELTGPILDAFQRAHPDLRVQIRELDFAQQFTEVLDGTVDVAIVRSPYRHDDLVMEPLFSEPSVLVASPEHPLSRVPEVSLDAALRERFLTVVGAPRPWRDFWDLAELRNDRSRSIPSRALCLLGYSMDLIRHATVSPMAQSGWRFGGLGRPTLTAVRLVGAPRSVIGVGYRRDGVGEHAAAFARTARMVATELISIVPEGEPVPAAGEPGHNEALLPWLPRTAASSPKSS